MPASAVGLLLTCSLLGAAPAAPQPAATAPVPYEVPVRVRLGSRASAAAYVHDPIALDAPSVPAVTVPIGDQALTAYVLLANRLFLDGSGRPATATLTIESADGSLLAEVTGWQARVVHVVSLSNAGGREVARWAVSGAEKLSGRGSGALPLAFARAAKAAARQLEADLAAWPAPVAQLTSGDTSAAQEPPPATVMGDGLGPRPPTSVRAARVFFVDGLLGGTVQGGGRGLSGLRIGGSGDSFLWQATASWWGVDKQGDWNSAPMYWLSAYGLDLGLVHRITAGAELVAGGGLQVGVLEARNAGPVGTQRTLQPALFAAVHSSLGIGAGSLLLRGGLEGRVTFRNTWPRDRWYGDYHAPDWSVGLVLGCELDPRRR